jgi:hypothetical protein
MTIEEPRSSAQAAAAAALESRESSATASPMLFPLLAPAMDEDTMIALAVARAADAEEARVRRPKRQPVQSSAASSSEAAASADKGKHPQKLSGAAPGKAMASKGKAPPKFSGPHHDKYVSHA